MDLHDVYTLILQSCVTGTRTISGARKVILEEMVKMDHYKNKQESIKTHSKARTVHLSYVNRNKLASWKQVITPHVDDRGNIDGLVPDCSNSIDNALELLRSCTKPSIHMILYTQGQNIHNKLTRNGMHCLPHIICLFLFFIYLLRLIWCSLYNLTWFITIVNNTCSLYNLTWFITIVNNTSNELWAGSHVHLQFLGLPQCW